MALVFFDGFDGAYNLSQVLRKWDVALGFDFPSTAGRRGGGAANGQSVASTLEKALPSLSTYIIGAAILPSSSAGGTGTMFDFSFDGVLQVEIENQTDGSIIVRRGTTQIGDTVSPVLNLNIYNYVEVRVVIDDINGEVQIRVNGLEVLNLVSVDTKLTTGASITSIRLGGQSAGVQDLLYDDLYILDETGSVNNTFLGDVQVDTLIPTGDGNSSAFDTVFPTSPTTHFDKVDGQPADDDTTYVETTTVGDTDLFTKGNLPSIVLGSVKAVQFNSVIQKLNSGPRQMRHVSRVSSVNFFTNAFGVPEGYSYQIQVLENNPNTGSPWTETEVDAAEFGLEVNT